MRILRRHIAPIAIVMTFIATMLVGCHRKPLYLAQRGNMSLGTAIIELDLDLLWGTSWKEQLQYPWDDAKHGVLGYSEPVNVRTIIYRLEDGARQSVPVDAHFGFRQEDKRVNLATNETYDLVFHSDGEHVGVTSVIMQDYANGFGYETNIAVTNGGHKAVRSSTRQDYEYNQPDQIFGTLVSDRYISDNPDDYIMRVDEDGVVSWVDTIQATLEPYTLIYLFQIIVINNRDMNDVAIIDRVDKVTITGMASSVDLNTRRTGTTLAAVSTEYGDVKERIADYPLTLPDGTRDTADIMAARVQTWGLPGIVPVVEVTRGGVEDLASTYLFIYPTLGNGLSIEPLQYDVTELMKERPGGGVITIVIDAEKEIPEDLIYLPESDGGFDATVNDWENSIEADITI
jgi:hypothetical protein